MFVVDTNVFLEILLDQNKKVACKKFLADNCSDLCITDFSFHSIGVILFRYNNQDVFQRFVEDVIPNVRILTLPFGLYGNIGEESKKLTLDFDDIYQYLIAKYHGLKIVTLDKDFENVKDVEVLFL